MIYKKIGGGKNTLLNRFSQGVKRVMMSGLLVMVGLVMVNLTSCQNLDDVYNRLDKVEADVVDLKSAVKALQDAYSQGKIIKSVTPLTDAKAGGWLVTFSDDTMIRIANSIVESVTQDVKTHVITIELADGSTFTFNIHRVIPTSISILNANPVYLTLGTQASVEFRVNPSNTIFNLSGDDCQIELDKVGTVQTRSSYVTTPRNYKLVRIEQVYDGNTEVLKVGQYRAIIEDTKKSAEYDEMAALVLNVEDATGDKVQISSSAFEVKGMNYENLPKTGLPIVIINTPNSDPITSKVDWMEGATMSIINPDMSFDYQGTLSVKGRGNSTWGYPKKPYALKLDKKEKVLGMKKHKRWCLLANHRDLSLLRNALAFEIGKYAKGLDWTPSGQYVEVVMNGQHLGNYYLCEQIKVDENRVNIAELDSSVTEGDGITGGFLFEIDGYFDEQFKFKSSYGVKWNFKDPDEDINDVQYNYAINYVNAMESSFLNPTSLTNKDFVNYIDLPSFAAYWIVAELAENYDSFHGFSVYMHKDINGKMKAGPIWDFDIFTFGQRYYGTPYSIKFYYKNYAEYPVGNYFLHLLDSPLFRAAVKEQWNHLYPHLKNDIPNFIDNTKASIMNSALLNEGIWFDGPHGDWQDKGRTIEESIDIIKEYLAGKTEYMNVYINNMITE